MLPQSIHMLGVPLDLGTGRRGVDMGPSAVRLSGLVGRLARLGHDVVDRGDLPTPGQETSTRGHEQKKYITDIAKVCSAVHAWVLDSLEEEDRLPLVLGGDHSIAAGSASAAALHASQTGKQMGLLWLDAHGDMNTPDTSRSGNVHGMALAALLGPEPAELAMIRGSSSPIDPERTVLLGVRNLDELEKAAVKRSGIHVLTMRDVDRDGIAAVVRKALSVLGGDTVGIHVSLDMDVCDPAIAPGVGTPVRGGLTYREAHLVMEAIADSNRLSSMDLVEINPILDVKNTTAELGAELVLSALGKRIL